MSHDTLTGKTLLENVDVLDTTIDQLLGQGLGYDDWKLELENLGGFAWTESLKNVIIKKEFTFFKEEILRLQSEPNTTPGLKSKTNSLESILERLQGLEWVKGVPDEMEIRKRDGRLLGRDAKARCLQYHVSRWRSEAASAFHRSSTASSKRKVVEVILEPTEFEAISSKLTQATPDAAAVTSPSTNVSIANPSNSDIYLDGDCFHFHKHVDVLNSDVSSIFGHTSQLPESDPTLSGDREIPWVAHTQSYEIVADGDHITLEDFFRFVEQEPNFPVEPLCEVPYFELPRRTGINDSSETYISQTRRDSNTHGLILEEILDHYGTQSKKDIWPSSFGQEITHSVEASQLDNQTCVKNTIFPEQDLRLLPQKLAHSDCMSDVEIIQFYQNCDTETLAVGNTFSSKSCKEEVSVCHLQDQTAALRMLDTSPTISYNKILDVQDDSLHQIEAELCKKRQELPAAEIVVSKLSTEVKLLAEAFAKRTSHHAREKSLRATSRPNMSRKKRCNDGALRSVKRLKGRAAAPNFESETFKYPNSGKTLCLESPPLSPVENTSPTTIYGAEGIYDHRFNRDNDAIALDYPTIPSFSNFEGSEPHLTEAVHSYRDSILRTNTEEHPPVSSHPKKTIFVQSLSTQTPYNSSFTSDSGQASWRNEMADCRVSSMEVMNNLNKSIAWVA